MDIWRQVCAFDTLYTAWMKVKSNGGSAGGDGVTIGKFQNGAGKKLHELSTALAGGGYTAGPCRRVDIPKRKGGFRTLMIPAIIDRVAHTAIAETLDPILDPTFEESSFAYRQGRSVKQAVARIERWRDNGYQHVIEADIVRYFDNINHEILIQKLKSVLSGHAGAGPLLDLISDLIDAQGIELGTLGIGLIQGSPLSPLLSNLYLDALDEAIDGRGIKLIRFADDFVILCKSERKAETAMDLARAVLNEHGLSLHDDGTRIVSFDKGFDFLGYLFVRSLAVKQDRTEVVPDVNQQQMPDDQRDNDHADDKSAPSIARYDRGIGVMYMIDPTHHLSLRNESFAVMTKGDFEVAAIPHHRIDRIEVGPRVEVDWQVLDHCLSTDTDIVFVNRFGERKGQLTSTNLRSGSLHLQQAALVLDQEARVAFARKLVEARIRNQRTQLFRLNRSERHADVINALATMGRNLRKMDGATTLEQLLGYEGASGALYWPSLGQLTKGAGLPFRRTRPALDALNATVNYLTAVLERDIRAAILGADLHPGFGILHSAHDYSEAAIYDLMEPFRAPLTEGLAAYLFNAHRLRPEMFGGDDVQPAHISREGRKAIISGYETAIAKRVNITGRKGKLAWRPMMQRQAHDLAKAIRTGDASMFTPYLMEA